MLILTKPQRRALRRVYSRILASDSGPGTLDTYRKFRRTVQPGPGCIMIPFCGMLLGIEPDGYTHS